MELTPDIKIEDKAVEERFLRSPGPGGQNVNKVETAVQLRFDPDLEPSLSEVERGRLIRLAGARADKEGVILIDAHRHRTRERNRADARERLARLIERARHKPKPRIPTRPSRAAKERRLAQKHQRAGHKRLRRRPSDFD